MSDKKTLEERKIKMECIDVLYSNRENTQKVISKKLNMSIEDVGKACRYLNYSHTKRKEHDNLNEGERIRIVIDFDDCSFLDKYTIDSFMA